MCPRTVSRCLLLGMTVVLGCAEPLAGPAASARNQVLDAELGLADPVLAGQLIAFVSARDGNFEIYVMKPDGSLQTRVTNNPAFDADPAWAITLTR